MSRYYLSEEITGKEVIEESEAKKIGVVRDIAFTMDGKVAFIVEAEDKKGEPMELFLPFDKIIRVGDVVIIKSAKDLEKPSQ
ncbi:MAG: PRC-barrel domain-containing protein [Candidatus Bathyarchaeia archaeon]